MDHAKFPDYPFAPQRMEIRSGIEMSYLDEGPRDGEVVVMLHGNPSWSYYWRHLVLNLRDSAFGNPYRCIVPDHIGMGMSDKPGDDRYVYTLQSRIEDLTTLMDRLRITAPITLAVHDWGGMIGFGWALSHAPQVQRLLITNTAAFPLPANKQMPWQLRLSRDSALGALLIRRLNAFAIGAARDGVVKPMPPQVRYAYTAPYDSWRNRIATLRFVQDIPLSERDAAWNIVVEAGIRLPEFMDRPALIAWGMQDFVFDADFYAQFKRVLPNAELHPFDDAGHYVLEDKHAILVPMMRRFLDQTDISSL